MKKATVLNNDRGSVFLLVMTFILVSLLATAAFHNHIRAVIKVAEATSMVDANLPALNRTLARGLSLLETKLDNTPPNGYACKLADPSGTALEFDWNTTASRWDVKALSSQTGITATCPANFSDPTYF